MADLSKEYREWVRSRIKPGAEKVTIPVAALEGLLSMADRAVSEPTINWLVDLYDAERKNLRTNDRERFLNRFTHSARQDLSAHANAILNKRGT